MKRIISAAIITLFFVHGSPVSAHDGEHHGAQSIVGTVETTDDGGLALRTETGLFKLTVTDATKIEHGEHVMGRGAVKAGSRVSVIGTKLPGGELVAKEVQLAPDTDASMPPQVHVHVH